MQAPAPAYTLRLRHSRTAICQRDQCFCVQLHPALTSNPLNLKRARKHPKSTKTDIVLALAKAATKQNANHNDNLQQFQKPRKLPQESKG